MNGYVFSNVRQIQDISVNRETTLALAEAAPLSVQLEASNTTLSKRIPDAAVNDASQKNATQFPQALSLFYTGKIADNLGAFLQLTWTPATNSVGIDNSDLRFADHGALRKETCQPIERDQGAPARGRARWSMRGGRWV